VSLEDTFARLTVTEFLNGFGNPKLTFAECAQYRATPSIAYIRLPAREIMRGLPERVPSKHPVGARPGFFPTQSAIDIRSKQCVENLNPLASTREVVI
jgi:hypothetical protein